MIENLQVPMNFPLKEKKLDSGSITKNDFFGRPDSDESKKKKKKNMVRLRKKFEKKN